jgi:predicted nucleic acid-binding protein
MIKPIFIDTNYILALVNTGDSFHNKARAIAEELTSPLLTTEAVLTR